MSNVNKSVEEKRVRSNARRELENLDSAELTGLLLDVVDSKTLSVLAASLKVARERGERETARVCVAHRKPASW
jgi:hypothetical protein